MKLKHCAEGEERRLTSPMEQQQDSTPAAHLASASRYNSSVDQPHTLPLPLLPLLLLLLLLLPLLIVVALQLGWWWAPILSAVACCCSCCTQR
jgi:hypothetical protein